MVGDRQLGWRCRYNQISSGGGRKFFFNGAENFSSGFELSGRNSPKVFFVPANQSYFLPPPFYTQDTKPSGEELFSSLCKKQ
jgi:hypothetical protein